MSEPQPATRSSSGSRWSNLERWQQLVAAGIGLVGSFGAVMLTIALTQQRGDSKDNGDSAPKPPSPAAVITVPTVSATSRPSAPAASFLKVEYRAPIQQGYQYYIEIDFSGLKGQVCSVTWETVYEDNESAGDSNGTITTGVLLYDSTRWWGYVIVRPPSGAKAGRPWHTVFKAYSPERVLLATAA